MSHNYNIGLFGQYLAVNATASSVSLNSTSFSTTSNTFTIGASAYFVANGNVGINNSAPTNTLSVNGTGYFGGNLNVTGDIATNYSDIRLKDVSGTIPNALNKVASLSGFYYTPNDLAIGMGLENGKINRVGVSAQEIQAVLPEAVRDAPGADGYLTVQYERIVPLLIEAIKELKYEIEELKRGNNGNS